MQNWFYQGTKWIGNGISDFLLNLTETIYSGLLYIMTEMINLICKLPLISSFPELHPIWKFMTYGSLSLIGLIIVYIAVKNLIGSTGNIVKVVEMKLVMGRMIYALIFIVLSPLIINWNIMFNNILIEALVSRFSVKDALTLMCTGSIVGNLVAMTLILVQMYLIIKVIIGYWLRLGELLLMYVAGPAIYTAWINPAWGGYLSEWWKRITTLIYTNFFQVLILAIYGKVVFRFFTAGTVSGICLGISLLILMTNVPSFFSKFMAVDNAPRIMSGMAKKITKGSRKINLIKSKLTPKPNV
jgi:hypothetical protein